MSKKNIAMIEMIVCSILWSIAGVLIKNIQCHPLVIAGVRSSISAVTVAVFMLVTKRRFKFTRSAALSGIFLCSTAIAFIIANKMTTAANAIVLQFISPLFVLLFSTVFYKEKLLKADIAVSFVTLGGILLFFLDSMDGGGMVGNLVAILSGVFIAGLFVVSGNSGGDERMTGIFMGQCFAAVSGLIFIPFTENIFDAKGVLSLVVLGIFQLGIPYILAALALGQCSPLACTLISVIEPLLNPVWVFIFNGEAPGKNAFIGAAIIIVSITLWCIYKDNLQKKTA